MASWKSRGDEIRRFILREVQGHPRDIAKLVSETYGITRQAASRYLRGLVEKGALVADGNTRERFYLLSTKTKGWSLKIAEHADEELVWRTYVSPLLEGMQDNVVNICYFGFTEMFNNVIDHSEGDEAIVSVGLSARSVKFMVCDDGVGIFEKIKSRFGMADHRQAIFALTKGKFTTDPTHHTGQGIFFTSRLFDQFAILSEQLYFSHVSGEDDWLIEARDSTTKGTLVNMSIALDSERTTKEVFDRFADLESGDYEFSKTHVPMSLAKFGKDSLISRSQAKRVLAGFDQFKEVWLDFSGIDSVGQSFADEIFRVYANQHPDVRVIYSNACKDVESMIRRAIAERNRQNDAAKG